MSNIILEASRLNGQSVVDSSLPGNNSSWKNLYKKPIQVNDGDILNVRNCFLNTQQLSSGGISFDTDQNLSIEIGYYAILYDASDKVVIDNSDFGTTTPMTNDFVDNGIYQVYTFDDDVHTQLINTVSITIKAGSYQPADLAILITKQLQGISPLSNSDYLEGDSKFLLRNDRVNNGGAYVYFRSSTPTLKQWAWPNSAFFGASQVALDFDEVLQKFKWTYIHTPLYNVENNQAIESVEFLLDGGKWSTINRQGGVFFANLTPASFWQTALGFSKDINIGQSPSPSTINQYTTSNAISIADLVPDGYMELSKGKHAGTYFVVSQGNTNSIYAENTYQVTSNGFFLLEIKFNFRNSYISQDYASHNIFGIISKQFNQLSYVTAFSDSSINYQHRGESVLLTSLEVRILDGTTRLPANLGPNNHIFIEIFQNEKPPKNPQPRPSK